MVVVNCFLCGKETSRSPNHIKKSKHVYCSLSCSAKSNNKLIAKPRRGWAKQWHCIKCGADVKRRNKYCRTCVPNFNGWAKGLNSAIDPRVKSIHNLSSLRKDNPMGNSNLRKAYLHYIGPDYKCVICFISDWKNQPLVLQVDHINGDRTNNDPSNLRLLCPNCHSQTDTYCGKNVKNEYVKESQFIEAIQNSPNVRQTLIAVGLTPLGSNYKRVYDIMIKHNLRFKGK